MESIINAIRKDIQLALEGDMYDERLTNVLSQLDTLQKRLQACYIAEQVLVGLCANPSMSQNSDSLINYALSIGRKFVEKINGR